MSAPDYAARDAYRRSVRNGAATIEAMCNVFGQIARENLAAREPIDFHRMCRALEKVLEANLHDEAWLHGFSRALADLLCNVAIGEVPALLEHIDPLVPWDPLGETAATGELLKDLARATPEEKGTKGAAVQGKEVRPNVGQTSPYAETLQRTGINGLKIQPVTNAAQVSSDDRATHPSAHEERLQAYAPPTAPVPAPLTPAAPPRPQQRRQRAPQRLPRPVRQQDDRALDAAARLREGFGSIPADSPLFVLERAWRAQVPA